MGETMAESKGSTKQREPTSSKLLSFLADFERLIDIYGTTVKGVVPESDSVAVIESLSVVAKTQVRNLAQFVSDTYGQSAPALRSEADAFFQRLGGEELMREGLAVAPKVASVQALIGISQIIELIKKIIWYILGVLFPKGIPPWIIELIEIIDEIVNAILGQRSQKAQHDANQNHIDFLRTMRILRQFDLENGDFEEGGNT
jgi:hypothetical protein